MPVVLNAQKIQQYIRLPLCVYVFVFAYVCVCV